MTPEEILKHLRATPFRPIRVHLSSGRSLEIMHPEFALLTGHKLEIGIPADPTRGYPDNSEYCSLLHIASIEEITAPVNK